MQQIERLRWNVAVIGKVGGRVKAESVDFAAPMPQRDRRELDTKQIEWRAVQHAGIDARNTRFRRGLVEDVRERAADGIQRLLRAEDRDRAWLPEVERTNIVQAHHVI